MLVLTRRIGDEIVIDDNIRVMVVAVKGDKVRIGITAPPLIQVDRKEVHDRRAEFSQDPDPVFMTKGSCCLAKRPPTMPNNSPSTRSWKQPR